MAALGNALTLLLLCLGLRIPEFCCFSPGDSSEGLSGEASAEQITGMQLEFEHSLTLARKLLAETRALIHVYIMDRLRVLGESFRIYSAYLEVIAEREKSQSHSSIGLGLSIVRLDLRDLRHHIHLQMSIAHIPLQVSAPLRIPEHILHPSSSWKAQVQALSTLRHLEQCLGRVVREFTFLRASVPRDLSGAVQG
ncbi:hypothetical protein NDU88_003597 [Pleurodeles waltl]|uniref:Interleukin-27 subunit alpha n=1 Tax=Pleurodeles waltl TaxID=8319 RepID=A0AAV7PAH2_PLEWA|nr:hypothetical protein NDU88_003597 [Pleurodeles waltl]